MKGRVASSIHDKHHAADIWITNFEGGKFRADTISRNVYQHGEESTASFTARVQKAQRKIKAELKLKAEFFKKIPEFKISWVESVENP